MNIYIHPSYKGQRVFKDFTQEWVGVFLSELKKEKKLKNRNLLKAMEVSLIYLKPSVVKKLNKKYRGKNKATDVLSFSGDGLVSLGEIILCQEELKNKSDHSHLNLKLFSQMIICHGLLHLFGYTHKDSTSFEIEMIRLQNKLLRKVALNLAPNYKNDFDIFL